MYKCCYKYSDNYNGLGWICGHIKANFNTKQLIHIRDWINYILEKRKEI